MTNETGPRKFITGFNIWILVLLAVIVAGLNVSYQVLVHGLDHVFTADNIIVWTLPIASYEFFALTCTGLTFVASLALVFGYEQYESVSKTAVFLAIASLVAAFISLGLDLGSLPGMIYFLLSPNFSSPMWWMGAFYSLVIILLLVIFLQLQKGTQSSLFGKVVSLLAFIAALSASSMLGAVFGLSDARPTWFGGFLPLYFPLTATLSGLSVYLLFNQVHALVSKDKTEDPASDDLARLLVYAIGIGGIFLIWRAIVASYTNIPQFGALDHIMQSGLFRGELLIGMVLPFIVLMVPGSRESSWGKIASSGMVLLGIFLGRINIIAAGQIEPIGVRASGMPALVPFMPNIGEWTVFAFSLAVLLLIYSVGNKVLKLGSTEQVR
jgi:molybdopterin-containing oxidoreductase family membrane subunit